MMTHKELIAKMRSQPKYKEKYMMKQHPSLNCCIEGLGGTRCSKRENALWKGTDFWDSFSHYEREVENRRADVGDFLDLMDKDYVKSRSLRDWVV